MPDLFQKPKPNLDYREKILALAQITPVQPQSVAKALNTNSILASAMLSELAEKGALAVSHLKVGSSPLYYVHSDASKLLNYVHALNEKDQQTLKKLQEESVLRDVALDPLLRVSLRGLKDFAKPLTVKYNDSQELFWKYFLVDDKSAENTIKNILEPQKSEPPPSIPSPFPAPSPIPSPIPLPPERTVQQPSLRRKTEKQERIEKEEIEERVITSILTDSFSKSVSSFFAKKTVSVLKETLLKKNENDYVLSIPTPVGKVTYYCKAVNKKRITDADLSRAFVEGQLQKLPVLYLHTGELSPKAKQMLTQLKSITVTKM